ncbi:MAG: RNA methyltransferase [Lachnospiraceae bacterium]|nr:RNA methyltransferase [Lachnospiraceae bacterium]
MNVIPINDLNDDRLSFYIGYNEPSLLHINEPGPGVFIAETPMVIQRVLDAGIRPLSFFVEERSIERKEVRSILARAKECDVFTAPLDVINRITGFNLTRGVLGAFLRPALRDPDELLASARHVVLLEDIVNPTNVGAIFRSAAALGADLVLLTRASSDPYYRRAARVSMGTVFQIPWTYVPDGCDPVRMLHSHDFSVISMALVEGAIPVSDPVLQSHKKTAVVFGSEGDGISKRTIDDSDHVAIIPMHNGVDSLNVAASSAVALYELFSGHQRT